MRTFTLCVATDGVGVRFCDCLSHHFIVSHQFVTSAVLGDSEEMNIGTLDNISASCYDAFDYAEHIAPNAGFNYVFADIWHDPTDGVALYKRFKSLELDKNAQYDYWINCRIRPVPQGDE